MRFAQWFVTVSFAFVLFSLAHSGAAHASIEPPQFDLQCYSIVLDDSHDDDDDAVINAHAFTFAASLSEQKGTAVVVLNALNVFSFTARAPPVA
ncbi:hypothetical protein ACFOEE_04270 [Pseudoalteromonas fenneropenaei]|uniref:Secreted protein n=1 Tax=Pseudoalteromonas fenneropenaei TaxID=1737459 RepID=A0ABV7CGU3_9GAMM